MSYNLDGGKAKDGDEDDYKDSSVTTGSDYTVTNKTPEKEGFTFKGWKVTEGTPTGDPIPGRNITINNKTTLTAVWEKNPDPTDPEKPVDPEKPEKPEKPVEPEKPVKPEKPVFPGLPIQWIPINPSLPHWPTLAEVGYVPPMLRRELHETYIIGYPDGTVRPLGNITRAEAATIFFRLLTDDVREKNLTTENPFSDVNVPEWYTRAISTMHKLGIVEGRDAKHFEPNAPITRAELTAMCVRFVNFGTVEGDMTFNDLGNHWAKNEIERARVLGWTNGYPDGTFRPDQNMSRAEVVTMINRVLARVPETEKDLLPEMRRWIDNKPSDWYYLAIQEATNTHEYVRKGRIHETWQRILKDPEWIRYEKY